MAVGWSRRRDDEPDHPDQPYIVAGVGIDPGNPTVVVFRFARLEPTPYAPPDDLQDDDDVIEPTRVFKPYVPSADWDKCIIETWVDEA
jgi:hypothetical protein